MGHVAKYIGGIMETPKRVEESGAVYETVSEAKQKEAVDFLNKQLFATPTWFINKDISAKTGINPVSVIGFTQDLMLGRILSARTLNKLLDAEAADGASAYQVTELLGDLKKGIWSELATRKPIDIYRRNLQKSYVSSLTSLLKGAAPPPSIPGIVIFVSGGGTDKNDIQSVVRGHLTALRSEILTASAGITDQMTKYHLQDLAQRIDKSLNPKD
jgi:hypothetical protein